MKSITEFNGIYELQRTLRFELKPNEETQRYLNEEFAEEDLNRAKYYDTLKKVLNDYYRYFLNQVLPKIEIKGFDINVIFDEYKKQKLEKNENDKNNYEKITSSMKRSISLQLEEYAKAYQLDEYKDLFKEDKSRLFEWLKQEYINDEDGESKYKNMVSILSIYDGYVTCLQNFKINRDNILSDKDNVSIAYRIVENLERFFDNYNVYLKINEHYPKLIQQFEDRVSIFSLQKGLSFISQDSIDTYNTIIGRPSDDEYAKGINQIINEFIQKEKLSKKDIPQMKILYDQILTEKESFFAGKINNDEELFTLINNNYVFIYDKILEIHNFIEDLFKNEENLKDIFINVKRLTDISVSLFNGVSDSWSILNKSIKFYNSNHKINNNSNYISLYEIQKSIEEFVKENDDIQEKNITDYYLNYSLDELKDSIECYYEIKDCGEINGDRHVPSKDDIGGKGYNQVQIIKRLLDNFLEAFRLLDTLNVYSILKNVEEHAVNIHEFINNALDEIRVIVDIYNRTRNYLTTTTTFNTSKVRNYLKSSSLLTGWSRNYENNGCYIFYNKSNYYLFDIVDKKQIDVKKLESNDGESWKLFYNYKILDSKNFPRVFIASKKFKEKQDKYSNFEEVKRIYENKEYLTTSNISKEEFKHNLIELINYYKYALSVHDDYKEIAFNFKESYEYNNIAEFFDDAKKSGYRIEKIGANFEYLKELAKNRVILLFQIYNKDFSSFSHGNNNLHTLYLKALFSDINIDRINKGEPFFKLNGNAQIYTRLKSFDAKITHPRNQEIINKNPLVRKDKETSVFEYDLIKDKRFTENKMFLYFSITINACAGNIIKSKFNERVNSFLKNNKSINVIGLDRGERNLLYYSVIDKNGNILEQNSLNIINNTYSKGTVEVDYHNLLDKKEKANMLARQTWGKIDSITQIKDGYLSNVIYKLIVLMKKYNAVIVLENLNKGMKNSRKKVEKQIYQKFEIALINKLNYLVFKNLEENENGGVLNGLQLTQKIDVFDDIGKQSGFLFYIDPSYTSKICPKTGFVNLLSFDYLNLVRAKEFISNFDSIRYNKDNQYFEFSFDYDKFGDFTSLYRKKWNVCSYGERWSYDNKNKQSKRINVTECIIKLFEDFGVSYIDGNNIKDNILLIDSTDFYKSLFRLLKLVFQIRNSSPGEGDQNDFILSPVMNTHGEFFDSRKAKDNEPKNADANGAYNIALKGLWTIDNISVDNKLNDCTREEWFKFRQYGESDIDINN